MREEVLRRMRMSLRIGPGPPGVLAAVAAGDPKSGVLASSSSPLLHTGSTEIKEGGRKNATAVRRLRRRRPMKEMLTARIYIGRERGRAAVALGTNIETIMVTMVLLNSQCNIISSTFPCQSSL